MKSQLEVTSYSATSRIPISSQLVPASLLALLSLQRCVQDPRRLQRVCKDDTPQGEVMLHGDTKVQGRETSIDTLHR